METYPENKLKGPAHHRRRTGSGNQRLGWQHRESNDGITKEVICICILKCISRRSSIIALWVVCKKCNRDKMDSLQ